MTHDVPIVAYRFKLRYGISTSLAGAKLKLDADCWDWIVAGSAGGLDLIVPKTDLRPTMDRVRGAIFSSLGEFIIGARVLDLFAGSGGLGIEALSRGAVSAILIERHHPTSQLIKKNAESLGLLEKCEVIFGDAFLWTRKQLAVSNLKSQISNSSPSPPWLVFCSPPYDFYVERTADMLNLVDTLWSRLSPGSTLVVEADERFDFSRLPEPDRWDVRTYPPAVVGILDKPTAA